VTVTVVSRRAQFAASDDQATETAAHLVVTVAGRVIELIGPRDTLAEVTRPRDALVTRSWWSRNDRAASFRS
jgi:hypothetical protein